MRPLFFCWTPSSFYHILGAAENYDKLMENWFSTEAKPTAYMLDTTEEAELIPEDVKFQLVCSSNEFIVDTGKRYRLWIQDLVAKSFVIVLKMMDDRQILTCIEYSGLPIKTIRQASKHRSAFFFETH